MTTALAPRFGDTFQPRTQAVPADPGALFGGIRTGLGGAAFPGERARAEELVRQYAYWTFIALRPICNLFAEQRPQISVATTRRGGVPRLNQLDRQWLRQRYGSSWLQNDAAELEPVAEGHPLRVLLEHVNSEDCWQEFAFETCQMWQLTGRFYWWLVSNGLGRPIELYVIPTPWVLPEYGPSGELVGYLIRTEAGESWFFPRESVIEGKFKSPLGKRAAFSPMTAAPSWQNATTFIERARELAYKRGVNPDLIVELAAENGYPDKAILDRIEAKFLSRVGGVEQAGRPLFLPPGIKSSPWSHSPREMDFMSSHDQNRDDVLALWGANRAVCGLQQDIMRANFEGAMVAFTRMTMNPLLDLFAGILTEKLAPIFDPRIRIWFQDCTPADATQELEEQRFDFSVGALTPNQRRQDRGYEPVEEPAYDTGYLPAGLSPLSESARETLPEPPDAPGGDEDEEEDQEGEEESPGDGDDEEE